MKCKSLHFDISQTEGREFPRLGVDELTGEVAGYDATIGALKEMSPVPVRFETPDTDAKGCYNRAEDYIAVAYVVCQYLGVDTSDYTFGYIAGWSKKRELPELKSALDTIRKAAAELIDGPEAREIIPQRTLFPQPKKYDRVPVR